MVRRMSRNTSVTRHVEFCIVLLRIVIGWHFFYEGWSKLLYPGWTALGYLKSTSGVLAGFFHWLAADSMRMRFIDQLNIWGLILVGIGLMLGLLIRPAALGGIALLGLYYAAYPPLFTPGAPGGSEGSYLIVNKNLVELFALIVVVALPASSFGLESFLLRRRRILLKQKLSETGAAEVPSQPEPSVVWPVPRRQVLASLVGVPVLGALVLAILRKHGWRSFEEAHLRVEANPRDAVTASASVKSVQFGSVSDLKGQLPRAKIGKVTLSRMILGGNLIGGWAHARDLIYVSELIKAYHRRDKVFETLALAESCGINAILTGGIVQPVISDYWRNGGKIQFIATCGSKTDMAQSIQKSIDYGACAGYIHDGASAPLVEEGRFDLIAEGLELLRRNGLPAGIGAHKLKTIKACVEKGLAPDFWMKTIHHIDYWSASPKPYHDNIWCEEPAETAAYMNQLKEPWIGFKVLAAGAIEPKVGFRYAFESGADFICVGMYDFQIVEDVNIALSILNGPLQRPRPWRV